MPRVRVRDDRGRRTPTDEKVPSPPKRRSKKTRVEPRAEQSILYRYYTAKELRRANHYMHDTRAQYDYDTQVRATPPEHATEKPDC